MLVWANFPILGISLTVQDPDGFSGAFQSPRDRPEVAAPVHIPLDIVVFAWGSKASEAILCARLDMAIFGIRLRVDRGPNLRGKLRAVFSHCALKLAQKPSEFVFLLGFARLALVVGVSLLPAGTLGLLILAILGGLGLSRVVLLVAVSVSENIPRFLGVCEAYTVITSRVICLVGLA